MRRARWWLMNSARIGTPAGKPSMTVVSALPCDSPAVRYLSIGGLEHHVEGRLDPGPDLEGQRRLTHQHAQPVDSPAAALDYGLHESRHAWIVDEVIQRDSLGNVVLREGRIALVESRRRAVDHELRLLYMCRPAELQRSAQIGYEPLGPLLASVQHPHPLGRVA